MKFEHHKNRLKNNDKQQKLYKKNILNLYYLPYISIPVYIYTKTLD